MFARTNRINWLWFLPFTLQLLPFPFAFASEPVNLGEIEVIAPDSYSSKDYTSTSQVIAPGDTAVKGTTETIQRSPGIHVKRYGSNESSATISIRGSPSNQVATYYDNVPLGTSSGNNVDLSIAPPSNIEKIEIYRGGAPARAPDASPAGAIFLNTSGRPEKLKLKIANSFGSFTTYKGNISVTQPINNWWYFLSLEHAQSEGNFTFVDDNGTRANTADDTMERRRNNDYKSENVLAKGGYTSGDLNIQLSNTYLHKRSGVPGLGSFQSENARAAQDRDVTIFNLRYEDIGAVAFFDFLYDQFYDPLGEIGLGRQNNDDKTFRFGEEVNNTFQLGRYNRLYTGLSHRSEFFKPKNLGVTGDTSSRHQIGVVSENQTALASERLIIIPSLRFNVILNSLSGNDPSNQTNFANDKTNFQVSGKFGAKYRILSDLYIKGNVYRGYRNPNFSELFGDRGALVGNPALSPETSLNFDGGLAFDGKFCAEALYFRNYTNNLIQFLQTSQFTARPENLSKALVQGVELSGQVDYLDHFYHSASYTYQDARDTSNLTTNGKALPGRPRHEAWFESATYNKYGRISLEYNFTSNIFLDSQNLLEVTARHFFNLNLSATPRKWVLINLAIKNLTNDRTVDVIGFPLPGRSYWCAVTFYM